MWRLIGEIFSSNWCKIFLEKFIKIFLLAQCCEIFLLDKIIAGLQKLIQAYHLCLDRDLLTGG